MKSKSLLACTLIVALVMMTAGSSTEAVFNPARRSAVLTGADGGEVGVDMDSQGRRFARDRIVVKFRKDDGASGVSISSTSISSALRARGGRSLRRFEATGLRRVSLAEGQNVAQAIQSWRDDPSVEYVEPDYVMYAATTDSYYSTQWGLKNTGQTISYASGSLSSTTAYDQVFTEAFYDAPRAGSTYNNPGTSDADMGLETAWARHNAAGTSLSDCSSVTVAVVDSGFNYDHEDFDNGDGTKNLWDGGASFPNHGIDIAQRDNDPMDDIGHGTHVAGTIGASGNNGIGIAGVCWRVKIMGVRVLVGGSGSTSDVAEGVTWAADHGAKVINMSLGGGGGTALKNAIAHARDLGVVVVVAAGNEANNNDRSPTYPCSYDLNNIVCVAAHDQGDRLADYSNYGVNSVHVAAPGTNIVSLWAGPTTRTKDLLTDFDGTDGWNNATWARRANGSPTAGARLTNPSNYNTVAGGGGNYAEGAGQESWRFLTALRAPASGYHAGKLLFTAQYNTEVSGDYFEAAYKAANSTPYPATSAFLLEHASSVGHNAYTVDKDGSSGFSTCVSHATTGCSVGFRLLTNGNATVASQRTVSAKVYPSGVQVYDLETRAWSTGNNGYNVISGTSMATPHVSGLAAMLFVNEPAYTWKDVVDALKFGGRPVSGLTGYVASGRAAHAPSALDHIRIPGGITTSSP